MYKPGQTSTNTLMTNRDASKLKLQTLAIKQKYEIKGRSGLYRELVKEP
jgi:hypothetical protein